MPPTGLVVVAWVSLGVALLCAAYLAVEVVARYRPRMAVMAWVWPVTALYAGPLAVWAYHRFGRPASPRWLGERGRESPPDKPRWATVGLGVTHCGAGCTLGDIVAATTVFLAGITLAGKALYAELVGDYLLAVLLGLVFQYFAIAPMRDLGVWEGIRAAAKADILSLTAFEVGLFGWMLAQGLVLFPAPHEIHPDSAVYWLGMQLGMLLGFATSYPVNAWLIARGTKEAM